MRVLQIITAYSDAAPAQSAAALAKYLPGDDVTVTAVSLRTPPASSTVADLRRSGVDHISLGMRGFLDATAVLRLLDFLRASRPDVVHTHAFRADLWAGLSARLARVPLVINTIRNHEWDCFRGEHSFAVSRLAMAGSRLATSMADALVAVSSGVGEYLARVQRVPPSKIHVIPNGFDFKRLNEPRAARDTTRAALGLRPQDVAVGALAVLKPRKGLSHLVAAAKEIVGAEPRAYFFLAGEGSERAALEQQIRDSGLNGRFRLLGHRPDPLAVLDALDVHVLPSLFEGLPRSILEAMALGKPVVATDIGGSREVVRHGVSGLIVPPRDPGALAAALRQLIASTELRDRLGAAGARIVRDTFDARATARAHDALYRSLLKVR